MSFPLPMPHSNTAKATNKLILHSQKISVHLPSSLMQFRILKGMRLNKLQQLQSHFQLRIRKKKMQGKFLNRVENSFQLYPVNISYHTFKLHKNINQQAKYRHILQAYGTKYSIQAYLDNLTQKIIPIALSWFRFYNINHVLKSKKVHHQITE